MTTTKIPEGIKVVNSTELTTTDIKFTEEEMDRGEMNFFRISKRLQADEDLRQADEDDLTSIEKSYRSMLLTRQAFFMSAEMMEVRGKFDDEDEYKKEYDKLQGSTNEEVIMINLNEKDQKAIKLFGEMLKAKYLVTNKISTKRLCADLEGISKELPIFIDKIVDEEISDVRGFDLTIAISLTIYSAIKKIKKLKRKIDKYKEMLDSEF